LSLRKYLPSPSRLASYRFLGPVRHHFHNRVLWRLDRSSVARGLAVGLFFGILTPVAQILFALMAAVALRANLGIAAASTLVTNPFTFPFVYYFAFRIGSFVTGGGSTTDVAVSEAAASQALDVSGWFPTLLQWASTIGWPLLVGVVLTATGAALSGYLLVYLGWTWISRLAHRS
jgi:hypothetical protein